MTAFEILVPTPPPARAETSELFLLGRGVAGVRVGLRLDNSWRSYFAVVDEWTRLLRQDGADVEVLVAGDRAGPTADQTRSDLEEWSRLVEVGVVGLGN